MTTWVMQGRPAPRTAWSTQVQPVEDRHQLTKTRSRVIRPTLALSPNTFIAIWWLLQSMHILPVAYAVCVLRVCLKLNRGQLEFVIGYLGDDAFWFLRVVVIACTVVITCHSAAFLHPVWCSLRHRKWCFTSKPRQHNVGSQLRIPTANEQGKDEIQPFETPPTGSVPVTRSCGCKRLVRSIANAASTMFSFEGKYYDATFLALETVEIALQTYQAYKLSTLVPRVWINHLYAAVLVLNCWSTVFVHAVIPGNQFVKRILLLAVDAMFDVITSIFIPTAIFLPTYIEFDPDFGDFPGQFYYDDVLFIQAVSESRQIFVTSWLDFVSKLSPFVTIFASVMALKTCFVMDTVPRPLSSRFSSSAGSSGRNPGTPKGAHSIKFAPNFRLKWVAPEPAVSTRAEPEPTNRYGNESSLATVSNHRFTHSQRLVINNFLHKKYKYSWRDGVFFLGGAIILAIYIHTSVVGISSHTKSCLLEMRPWLAKQQSCATFEVNCARGEFDHGANVDSLGDFLSRMNPAEVKVVVFSGCAHLHVPPVIQTFSSLTMLKFYNSTVEVWDKSAELRDDLHRELFCLFVCDSNFSNGELPVGVMSDNFPARLSDIEFSGTNLVGLPSDLHEKWRNMFLFLLERSPSIVQFPTTLAKMPLFYLSLRNNQITSIPDELLVDQALGILLLDTNPLETLPRTIGSLSRLFRVDISFTPLSVFPEWITTTEIDPATGRAIILRWGSILLMAEGTALCDNSTRRQDFAIPALPHYMELECSFSPSLFSYPVEFEREWRARSQALFG